MIYFDDHQAVFQLFELSPTNESVYQRRGRLIRQFPAIAIGIPAAEYAKSDFQGVLAKTIAKMSYQEVEEALPKAKKAGQYHNEQRETTDPLIVTELLSSFLRGIGNQVHVAGISKRTSEEVIWNHSKLPWRRSALWLLVRVSLQLALDRVVEESETLYKSFMVFLVGRMLHAATKKNMSSEMLKIMMSKVSRRLLKLQHGAAGKWPEGVHTAVSEASRLLNERWRQIRNDAESQLDLVALSQLNMAEDADMSLPRLDGFVSSIQERDNAGTSSSFRPKSDIPVFKSEELPFVPICTTDDTRPFLLAMIESWVSSSLDGWLGNHIRDPSTCHNLITLMQDYHEASKSWYKGRPEGASRMILVILELWVAADKVATRALPLLKRYEHEIPIEVFQALLLGFREDMDRLHRVEEYLKGRRDDALSSYRPSVFRSYGERRSFPVEYFSQSLKHQNLLGEIEKWAEEERQSKREDFRRMKQRSQELMQQYEEGFCQEVEYEENGLWMTRHASYCSRCKLRTTALNLEISVHEWPLPTDPLDARAAVFELALPESFGAWRDGTLYVIDDVLRSTDSFKEKPPSASYPLRSYHALSQFSSSPVSLRVHLLSSTKPHVVSHRRDKKVYYSSESDVCVNNGLQFRYFDNRNGVFLHQFSPSTSLSELCTFALGSRSQQLKDFLVRTHDNPAGQVPNAAIASQSKCPEHLSLGEFKALATLTFGYRIQWMSILTQLAMPDVDFNKAETAIILLQLSLQAGPDEIKKAERCAHTRLSDANFGRAMLSRLQDCVSRTRENWESYTALWIFSFLAARLLSLASPDLRPMILEFLKQCREISYQWLEKLRSRALEADDEEQRAQLLLIALRISLICADSFNVDDGSLTQILFDPQQAAILLEASIYVRNHALLMKRDHDILGKLMHDRWMFTMHRSRRILVEQVLEYNNSCLDLTVKRCWPDFQRASIWRLVKSTCSWFETSSARLKVHVNILTGELLINGDPLSRLPREYEVHKDYEKLFGSFGLDVMPSSCPGMRFCSTQTFQGHTVHFGRQLEDESDLLICLRGDGEYLDLVPARYFVEVLPHSFVTEYTHWYNHDSRKIELRPLGCHWNSSEDNWELSQHESIWRLTRTGNLSLLAPTSRSVCDIADILSPLDTKLNLHMIFDANRGVLEIKVPSLQLDFLLIRGESAIRSRQFRGMQIDANQSIGTLVGFKSKLIIVDTHDPENRMVIIPEGYVSFEKHIYGHNVNSHIHADVTYGTARRIQRYSIDNQLRRLVDNATVTSKLYLAYIHALSSYCMPDPFLGRTGTEEALSILRSASLRSLDCPTEMDVQLLGQIAALTPGRSFYPAHLRSMQTVEWSPKLSPVSQDSRFYKAVKTILDRVSSMGFLYGSDAIDVVTPSHAQTDLFEREILRNSRRQVSGFGAEIFTPVDDIAYSPRDRRQLSPRATIASETAYKVYHGKVMMKQQISQGFLDVLYNLLSYDPATPADKNMPQRREMEYDVKWFRDPKTFLPAIWCRLHYAFKTNKQWINKFQAMMWLTTLAYSSNCRMDVLQALTMLSMSAHLAESPLPDASVFALKEGYSAKRDQLQSLVQQASKAFGPHCPEMSLEPFFLESSSETQRRRKNAFKKKKTKMVESFVNELAQQWPCSQPNHPHRSLYSPYLNVSSAMASVQSKWGKWHGNLQFRHYLTRFISRLDQIKTGSVHLPNVSHRDYTASTRHNGYISVDYVFSAKPPSTVGTESLQLDILERAVITADDSLNKLNQVLNHLDLQTKFKYEQRYLSELQGSLLDLQSRNVMQLREDSKSERAQLFEIHLRHCKSRVQEMYNAMVEAVSPRKNFLNFSFAYDGDSMALEVAFTAGLWPRLSPCFFLQQLGRLRWPSLSGSWRKAIVAYGIAITALQQAQRLVQLQDQEADLLRELENTGHKAWDPHDYPEWLLLECESGIIIRDVQHQIAKQMISPPDNQNSVMQLLMGEGKSSVIVPIVATVLSNGSQILRTIVAKPQAKQMHQMLESKLSGLLDRPVFRMPFSRAVRMDKNRAAVIRQLAMQCMEDGGVLLVQPEHLLSFQLMGLEYLINGKDEIARSLLDVQRLFDDRSRDIVDESDENFSVKFELIYTIGLQQPIEHTPHRWGVIQQMLARFAEICKELKDAFPDSIDIDNTHPSRFPRIRILGAEAESSILDRLARSICDTGFTAFPIAWRSKETKDALHRYITQFDLSAEQVSALEENPFWGEATMYNILLLRGLLSCGILGFTFGQKRWRVDYGTDPNRETKTRLAVPFRAKDNPSQRSEFSHPDVVIVLTCLSYYYKGLQDDELFEALDLLIRSDNAALEYQAWLETAPELALPFRQLTGINIRDRAQCVNDIFPRLRFSKGAIDFFLSRLVFAKESRQFPYKLSASGWDLGKMKVKPTTGFSGTNDSRYVLPMAMKQLNLPEQNHTNALVMEYLLRPENDIKLAPEEVTGATLDSKSLLKMVSKMSSNTRVILDVGAQIIDLDNFQFAETWLQLYKDDEHVQAVVFFGDSEELTVLDKSGKVEPLQISPFATQLDQCLVFLDEAHTRGTDLRLPTYYQAAVTLGANLTKDKLMQGKETHTSKVFVS